MSFIVQLPLEQYPADALSGITPVGFSLGNARAGAWLAQLAYENDPEKIAAVAQRWGLHAVASFQPSVATILPLPRTRGFVMTGRGIHFVAFCGTDPLVVADWVSDFDFPLDERGIHRGFRSALDAAWPDVAAALTGNGPAAKVWFIGHSLGAAIAALGAKRGLEDLAISSQAIYALGMPRVGNKHFADEFETMLGDRTYRLVHGDDIVSTVPPTAFGFRHVGRLLRCPRHGKFDARALSATPSDEPQFDQQLLGGLKSGLFQFLSGSLPPQIRPDILGQTFRFLPPPIADHLPDRYWRALDPR